MNSNHPVNAFVTELIPDIATGLPAEKHINPDFYRKFCSEPELFYPELSSPTFQIYFKCC